MALNESEQKQLDEIERYLMADRQFDDNQFAEAMKDSDASSTHEPVKPKIWLSSTKKTRPERLSPKRWHAALAAGVIVAFATGVALDYADSLRSSYVETYNPTPTPSLGQSPDVLPSPQPQVENTVPSDFGNDFIEGQNVVPKIDPSATGHRILTGREPGVE